MKLTKTNLLILLFSLLFTQVFGQELELQKDTTNIFDSLPSRWVLNINTAPIFTSLSSDKFSDEENRKAGINGGVDLAYCLKTTGKLKIALSIGLSYSAYNSNRNLQFYDSVWTTDFANDPVHLFEYGTINETQKAAFLNVPLKIGFTWQLSPQLDLYLNTGYYYSLVTSKTYSSSATITRKGFYPVGNILLYDIDVDGSHLFYPSNKALTSGGDLKLKNSWGIEAALGLKYKISPKYSLFIGIKLSKGLSSISDYAGNDVFTYANNSHTMNTLMDRKDKITTNVFGLDLGIAINLGKWIKQEKKN